LTVWSKVHANKPAILYTGKILAFRSDRRKTSLGSMRQKMRLVRHMRQNACRTKPGRFEFSIP
jgi:hypothetical protein